MLELFNTYYDLIVEVIVPIVVAILGLLAVKTVIKKITKNKQIVKGNNNSTVGAGALSEKSFNTIEQTGVGAKIVGNNNVVASWDKQSIQMLAQSFSDVMYPHAKEGFESLRTNATQFLASMNDQLKDMPKDAMGKFSEADVQMVLRAAIHGAGRTDSKEVHDILGQLVSDRVLQPKRAIAELAINQSVEVASKLDANLIQMLGFSFLFSRTKFKGILTDDVLYKRFKQALPIFQGLDITNSKFEYLESISCGKILQFSNHENIANLIRLNYPQLFLKPVTEADVKQLNLPATIESSLYEYGDVDGQVVLNPHIALHLYEMAPLRRNGEPFEIGDDVRDKLKDFLSKNRLTAEEIKEGLLRQVTGFDYVIKLWQDDGFCSFALTSVGIAIGRAYLEQKKLGNFDINTWIN